MRAAFSDEERARYERNIALKAMGETGQERLRQARVAILGAGGIGSPAIIYLAAAGIGQLTIIDSDSVELSNLQRQILHRTSDIGRPKAESAKDAVQRLNPHCNAVPLAIRLDADNIQTHLAGHDAVIDGSDTFQTRFIVADACWKLGIPLISAAALAFQGQIFSVVPGAENPCLRCLIPEAPHESGPASREEGILGAVAGTLGAMAAAETIRILIGAGNGLASRMMTYDALNGQCRTLRRAKRPGCFCTKIE